MAANVLDLIKALETHIEQQNAQLKALRDENSALKQQLSSLQDANGTAKTSISGLEPGDDQSQGQAAFTSPVPDEAPNNDHEAEDAALADMAGMQGAIPAHDEAWQHSDAQGEQEPSGSVANDATDPALSTESREVLEKAPEKVLENAPEKEVEREWLEKGASESVNIDENAPPSPSALLKQWYERYPLAFFKGHTKPLKVGIHQDLAEREPWSGKLIRRALANYVNLPRYVKSMREGVERVDLDGQPAGKVDKQAAQHAQQRRQAPEQSTAKQPDQIERKNVANKTAKSAVNRSAKSAEWHQEPARRHHDKSMQKPTGEAHQALSLEDKLKGLQQKFKEN